MAARFVVPTSTQLLHTKLTTLRLTKTTQTDNSIATNTTLSHLAMVNVRR